MDFAIECPTLSFNSNYLAESRNPTDPDFRGSTQNPISQAPKTAGFVPDFASTTGHSIPDPDDPETRFTRKKRGSRPKNRVFFYTGPIAIV